MLHIFLFVLAALIAKQWLKDLENATKNAQRKEDEKKDAIEAAEDSDDGE